MGHTDYWPEKILSFKDLFESRESGCDCDGQQKGENPGYGQQRSCVN